MEKSELVDLIPLYVTGNLSDEQKGAIERELPNSPELREEIAFWKAAHVAANHEAAFSLSGHLTSERIVDYARGAITSPVERAETERHLQGCHLCRRDFESIRTAFVTPMAPRSPVVSRRLLPELWKSLKKVRLIYALPLIALLLVTGILMYRMRNPEPQPISFALQFQVQDRFAVLGKPPTLLLPQDAGTVHLFVPIPRATVEPAAENIRLILSTPDEREIQLKEGLSWTVGSGAFDTAGVFVAASVLRTPGIYSLRAAIKYTPTSAVFEYTNAFIVEREKQLP